MADLLLEIPKAELHLHLEGSVEPETLHELDPATPVEEFRSLYSYTDFDAFLRAFGAIGKRLRTPEDYALITRRLLERLAAQNVRYAEITIAAGKVMIQASAMLRSVLICRPDPLAAIVPATPEDSTCVVLTGRP